jgi:hypothetical protein
MIKSQFHQFTLFTGTSASNRREARGIPSLLDPDLDLYLLVARPDLNLDIDLAQAGTALKYALVQRFE